jgi:hypothetical protein
VVRAVGDRHTLYPLLVRTRAACCLVKARIVHAAVSRHARCAMLCEGTHCGNVVSMHACCAMLFEGTRGARCCVKAPVVRAVVIWCAWCMLLVEGARGARC